MASGGFVSWTIEGSHLCQASPITAYHDLPSLSSTMKSRRTFSGCSTSSTTNTPGFTAHDTPGLSLLTQMISLKLGPTSRYDQSSENSMKSIVGVNWRIHTSSGLLTRPSPARKSFTTCIEDDVNHASTSGFKDNKLIKSIVKSSFDSLPINSHKFNLKGGAQTMCEHGDVIENGAVRIPITRDRFAIHRLCTQEQR
jgi:hypothetical protein